MAGRNLEIGNELYAVTKSDTADNAYAYLYVGTGGDVAIVPTGSATAVTFKNVPAGAHLWIKTSKVMSTNTTASDIVGIR
jgi:hypothetical protein